MANDRFSITATAPFGAETISVFAALKTIRDWFARKKTSLPHYGSATTGDAGATAIANDYGLSGIDGKAFQDLVTSCANDLTGVTAGTVLQQLVDRTG